MAANQDLSPRVKLETTLGDIVLELDRQKAPITVENFLYYVNTKYYDGLIFHRVIPTFMIQGGGYDADVNRKAAGQAKPIKNESNNGLKNVTGTIAMARTASPDSATNEFFINVVDNAKLDYPQAAGSGYAVFGKVTAGMDVVDKIKTTKCIKHPKYPAGEPVTPETAVVIKKARMIDKEGKEIAPPAKAAAAPEPAKPPAPPEGKKQ